MACPCRPRLRKPLHLRLCSTQPSLKRWVDRAAWPWQPCLSPGHAGGALIGCWCPKSGKKLPANNRCFWASLKQITDPVNVGGANGQLYERPWQPWLPCPCPCPWRRYLSQSTVLWALYTTLTAATGRFAARPQAPQAPQAPRALALGPWKWCPGSLGAWPCPTAQVWLASWLLAPDGQTRAPCVFRPLNDTID